MFGSPSTPFPSDAQRAVEGYETRLQQLLVSCVDHQRHDPEVFLWNARRALECMCHLLITVQAKKPSIANGSGKEHSLDSMIQRLKHENVLDAQQATRFTLARAHTNLGVHIQQAHAEDYSPAVKDSAHVLPELVEWLYEASIAKPYVGQVSRMPTQAIREGGREGPSLKDAATKAEMNERTMERTAASLRGELEEKTAQLRIREARWWAWARRGAVASAFSFGTGICVGVFSSSWVLPGTPNSLSRASSATTFAVAEPPEALGAAAEPVVDVQPVATPAQPFATAPPAAQPVLATQVPLAPPTCPEGMSIVPALTAMRLGQPVGGRKNWPAPPRGALEPIDVPAFCLDSTPRARTAVDRSRYDVSEVRHCERHQVEQEKPLGRTCLDRAEAEAVCVAVVTGGHLPSLVEWESAARARIAGLQAPVREWTGERFPPAPLRRFDARWDRGDGMWVGQIPTLRKPTSDDGAVLLAWNQGAPENRDAERSFRCAAPLP